VVCTSWRLVFLHVDGIYLVKLGFILLSCEIGKEIFAFCWYFLLVSCYTCLKPLEEYKGIHPPPRSILFVI
jgi:hypothetical protein